MAWNDRDYGNSRYDARNSSNPILRILFGSVPIGTYFGTRVRVHSTLIILLLFRLFSAGREGSVQDVVVGSVILFLSILLHEFGHCFGSRIMGGTGDDILMWPLGGLAMVAPPRRPWPSFVSTAAGPLVNLILCLITGAGIFLLSHFKYFPPLDPRIAFDYRPLFASHQDFLLFIYFKSTVSYYLWWIFTANWTLLIFNLCLVMYPFDMGRMIQETLWAIVGYRKSMHAASIIGMVGSILLAMFAVAVISAGGSGLMFLMIAIFGFMTCYRTRMEVLAGVYDEEEGIDYSASLRPDPPRKRKKSWFRNAAKKAAYERAEQAKIDAILAKVHDKGLHSLNWREKRTLKRATERQRQRDLAERL